MCEKELPISKTSTEDKPLTPRQRLWASRTLFYIPLSYYLGFRILNIPENQKVESSLRLFYWVISPIWLIPCLVVRFLEHSVIPILESIAEFMFN